MELIFKDRYKTLSDREIVDRIITEPYDDEAAAYLIYCRYEPLCVSVCLKTLGGTQQLDELQSELFILLKGKNQDWHALRSFQWRSSLGSWLKITAYNFSLEFRRQLIENNGDNLSMDNGWSQEDQKRRTMDIPSDEEELKERRYRMMLLQEAINMLDNADQKFVVKNRLQGFSSKEIAKMLLDYWKENNMARYNNRREPVVPDSGYIDNLFKRGYDKVKRNYKLLDR